MANEDVRIAGQKFYKDELYHHGVLGMKWGQHIFGGRSSGGKKRTSNKAVTKSKPKKKTVHDLSDDELNTRISRMQKETQYLRLYNELNPKKESYGRKLVNGMKDAAVSSITNAARNAGQQFVEKEMKKALGLDKPTDNTKYMQDQIKKWSTEDTYNKMKAARETSK